MLVAALHQARQSNACLPRATFGAITIANNAGRAVLRGGLRLTRFANRSPHNQGVKRGVEAAIQFAEVSLETGVLSALSALRDEAVRVSCPVLRPPAAGSLSTLCCRFISSGRTRTSAVWGQPLDLTSSACLNCNGASSDGSNCRSIHNC